MTETLALVWDPVLATVQFGTPFGNDFGKHELRDFILNALLENVFHDIKYNKFDEDSVRACFNAYVGFDRTVEDVDVRYLWGLQSHLDDLLKRMGLDYKIRFIEVDCDSFPQI